MFKMSPLWKLAYLIVGLVFVLVLLAYLLYVLLAQMGNVGFLIWIVATLAVFAGLRLLWGESWRWW
jgi:hypothetical protein